MNAVIGPKLRRAMEQNHHRAEDVAHYVGCSSTAVYFWLAGTNEPTKQKLERLCVLYGWEHPFLNKSARAEISRGMRLPITPGKGRYLRFQTSRPQNRRSDRAIRGRLHDLRRAS